MSTPQLRIKGIEIFPKDQEFESQPSGESIVRLFNKDCSKYGLQNAFAKIMSVFISELLKVTGHGLYCEKGDFYVDPWRPVERAFITHSHSDHARWGAQSYFTSQPNERLLRTRLGEGIHLTTHAYGEKFKMGDVWVSFHPAGHILGSSQIRIEDEHCVWVASGDFKRDPDPSCEPFEVVPCDVFISEATFALPIYRWKSGQEIGREILDWWMSEPTRPSLLFCYALGKAQRVLAELAQMTDRKVYLHGATQKLTEVFAQQGIQMLPYQAVSEMPRDYKFAGDLILAPPSAHRSSWMKRFSEPQTGFASGWMQVKGAKRRRSYERGFVLSDHADWDGLIQTVHETGAKRFYFTHGSTDAILQYLKEQNIDARALETEYGGDETQDTQSADEIAQ